MGATILVFLHIICFSYHLLRTIIIIEPPHEISNNMVCATSKGSGQPAHTHSLIRDFACHFNIL